MKGNFYSVRQLLTSSWLFLFLLPPILPRSLDHHAESDETSTFTVTYPTLQTPAEEMDPIQGTTPSDLDLNFDTVGPVGLSSEHVGPGGVANDQEGADLLETTTSVTSSSSVVVKTGRHFGSRIQAQSSRSSTPATVNIIPVPPALKPRPPTAPMISNTPANYNRILKRRKSNSNGTVIESGLSKVKNNPGGTSSGETTEDPPIPTTSQYIPTTQQQRRKVIFGIRTSHPTPDVPTNQTTSTSNLFSVETEIPTTTFPPNRNRRVKISPVRMPTLPPKVSATNTSSSLLTPEVESSHSWGDVNRGPFPPPPTFEPNEDFTLDPDGVYRFKYSSPLPFPTTYPTSRIYSQEFGVTNWGNQGDEVLENEEEEETTLRIPPTVETAKKNLRPVPTVILDASEDEFSQTVSPVYRNYFGSDEPQHAPDEHGAKEPSQVTVTVTVTQKVNSNSHKEQKKENAEIVQDENLVNYFVIPTPVLPELSPSSSSTQRGNMNATSHYEIFPTEVTENVSTLTSQQESEEKRDEDRENIQYSMPPFPSDFITPTPVMMSSKEYKSIFYSTVQNPHYTSTTYSYASSTEITFSYPEEDEDHHFHGQENHHDHETNGDLQHHHGGRDKNKNLIQPTTSTYYWDTVGLKTSTVTNQSETVGHSPPDPANNIRVTTPESTVADEVKKPPEPTAISPEETKEPSEATTPHAPVETLTTPPETATSAEDNAGKADSGKHEVHYPPVASYIQVFLDMPAVQFCPSIKSFKETIILVYKYNNREVGMEQVVLYNEPNCMSVTPVKTKLRGGKSQNSSPSTNSAATSGDAKEEDSGEKVNKTRHEVTTPESGEAVDSADLYPVYVYLIDKNGSYDQILTELFIDLWNLTKVQDLLLFNRIKKVEMIISTDGIGGEEPQDENAGVIAAITVASIAAFCLLLLGILLLVMRHRQSQNNFAKRCTPVTLDDYSLDNISVFNSFRRKQRNRASKRSYTNAGFDDPNAPTRILDVQGLSKTIQEVGSIYDEFSRIPSVLPTLDDIPNGAESKNRYANVIPMPDTRVLLTFQDEQPNSDYINANFIQGANCTNKAYIITQGPLEETLVDFWRMIWEQQVRVIFMLTDFSEAGIPKCAEYYPRSETIECSQLHGDFQVTLEKRDISENCIISFLVLKDMARSLRRDVVHLWYHTWPEKGIPNSPQSTVDFLLKSRKYTRESTPILVHCSPGTGRSGTLVACDIGLKQLETERKVDIPQIVKQLRHDRAGVVQTKEQYRHIYDVLHVYGTKYLSSPSKDT